MKKIKILLFPVIMFAVCFAQKAKTEKEIATLAKKIHDKVLTVDTHTDTPMGFSRGTDPGAENGLQSNFNKMEKGGLDAVFYAAFISQGKRDAENHEKAKNRCLEIIESIHAAVAKNTSRAEIALSPDDAYAIEKKGKRAIFIGIENGYPVGNDATLVEKFYKNGARYITLCHTKNNNICDSSTDSLEHGGLTELGKKVVAEMNRLGMLVDVSHISDKSFYDVIKVTKAPVIASHSCARAVCDNPRNLTDDMLLKLKANGGVLQLCILGNYIKATPAEKAAAMKEINAKYPNRRELDEATRAKYTAEVAELDKKYPGANVKDAVDHIDHIVKVIGIDFVGIGTDFDGGGGLPDCKDSSELGNITIELVRRGYTEDQIRKIWGGNIMRVFRQVQKLAVK